jgi:hypothetical protein
MIQTVCHLCKHPVELSSNVAAMFCFRRDIAPTCFGCIFKVLMEGGTIDGGRIVYRSEAKEEKEHGP